MGLPSTSYFLCFHYFGPVVAYSHFSTSYTAHGLLFLSFRALLSPFTSSRPICLSHGPVIHYSCRLGLMVFFYPFANSFLSVWLGFSLPLGLPKWPSTFSPLNIWSIPAVHMWIKTFLPSLSFHLLFFCGLFEQWSLPYTHIYIHTYIYIYIYSCCEQCCLFGFPNLAVILKHSRRFINFILFLMGNSLPPFVPALMTWVFKKESLCNPKTNSFLLSRTLFPFSLSSLFPFPQTPHTSSSIKFLHNDTGEKPKLLPS